MAEWLREPAVGQWFRTADEPFEIVGVDAQAEVVLVQHYDGTLEDLDFDAWLELSAQPCAPPEDYSGALDIEPDDYGLERDELSPRSAHGGNPLDQLDLRDL